MAVKISGGNELINPKKLLEQGGLKAGETVADLGCGSSGHFVFPAAHLVGENGRVYAVDILPAILQGIESRARIEGLSNITSVWTDLERPGALQIEGGADVALLVNTLFQVKDAATVIKEAARILKPGGTLLVAEWKATSTPLGPQAMMRIDSGKVKEWAQGAGLVFGREFEAGPYHYGFVFKK